MWNKACVHNVFFAACDKWQAENKIVDVAYMELQTYSKQILTWQQRKIENYVNTHKKNTWSYCHNTENYKLCSSIVQLIEFGITLCL